MELNKQEMSPTIIAGIIAWPRAPDKGVAWSKKWGGQ